MTLKQSLGNDMVTVLKILALFLFFGLVTQICLKQI